MEGSGQMNCAQSGSGALSCSARVLLEGAGTRLVRVGQHEGREARRHVLYTGTKIVLSRPEGTEPPTALVTRTGLLCCMPPVRRGWGAADR